MNKQNITILLDSIVDASIGHGNTTTSLMVRKNGASLAFNLKVHGAIH
jgi:hypothetical protein